jgi:hypothetical protein
LYSGNPSLLKGFKDYLAQSPLQLDLKLHSKTYPLIFDVSEQLIQRPGSSTDVLSSSQQLLTNQQSVSQYYLQPDGHLYLVRLPPAFEEKAFKSAELPQLRLWVEQRQRKKQEWAIVLVIETIAKDHSEVCQ